MLRTNSSSSYGVASLLVVLCPSCFQGGEDSTSATAGTTGAGSTTVASTAVDGASTTTSSSTTDAGTSGDASTSSSSTSQGTSEGGTTDAPSTSVCGDGVVEGDETCDLGADNTDEGLCTTRCQLPRCGDGFLQLDAGEECDYGDKLNDDGAACLKGCSKATCGDDEVWLGVEECDDGDENQAGLYEGCTPMTCTLGPRCGDEIVQQPWEECDLGDDNGSEDGACGVMCKLDGKMVFVTSKAYTGEIGLGGVAAADDGCNTLAMEAGLANAGNFRAWISDSETSPSTWDPRPEGPFILPNGTVIAQSWADLTDGNLDAKVNVLETGAVVKSLPQATWTGTSPEGLALGDNCLGWTTSSQSKTGVLGSLKVTDAAWTNSGVTPCWFSARLICVEQ